ncbi:putative zinc-binding oxidoreductase [Annulohypoxylon maeteangense]|uniref:putative zinc-binding oxidoreductase n=1 Tax=Annulohypoxylon maeteangense TaxID=1927788 RepID=UPI0020088711|nr:putative zinc-binding oxidoreductase [Annulohypoxylon maeteangense]KAI0879822.1 putative zinc-binding oxidoreductase [Annulohypoxylon maeteangense]
MQSAPPKTMRAVICTATGPASIMEIQDVPLPTPQPSQVLIRVLGFGINRAEMFTRQGHSPGVEFPRIIGIECVGVVAGYPTAETAESNPPRHAIGTRVATCMGGLGRQIPGSYAEYTCVSEANVRPIPETNLSVGTLAALPEMLQTTWGSLVAGLDLKQGESLLVRGATSSIGLCALQLARKIGAIRIGATSRDAERGELLRQNGATEFFVDDGNIAREVSRNAEGGFDKILELTGTTTLRDSIKCAVPKGTVCMTGLQGGEWEMEKFTPMGDLPNRVRLCAYGGGPDDFMALPWEELIHDIETGKLRIPMREFKLEDIRAVHEILESGGGGAKMVVVVSDE